MLLCAHSLASILSALFLFLFFFFLQEVKVEERSADSDEFLVLACDGVWDVMTNQEVASFVCERTVDGVDDLGTLAECLIEEGLHRNSRDNMSAVIVAFAAAPKPTPEAIEAYKRHAAEVAALQAAAGAGAGDDIDEGEK